MHINNENSLKKKTNNANKFQMRDMK